MCPYLSIYSVAAIFTIFDKIFVQSQTFFNAHGLRFIPLEKKNMKNYIFAINIQITFKSLFKSLYQIIGTVTCVHFSGNPKNPKKSKKYKKCKEKLIHGKI